MISATIGRPRLGRAPRHARGPRPAGAPRPAPRGPAARARGSRCLAGPAAGAAAAGAGTRSTGRGTATGPGQGRLGRGPRGDPTGPGPPARWHRRSPGAAPPPARGARAPSRSSSVRGRWHSRTTAISRSTRGWGDFRISVSASRRPRRSRSRSASPAPPSVPSAVSRAVSSCVASGPGVPVTATRSARRRTSIVSSQRSARSSPPAAASAIRWSASAAARRTSAPARRPGGLGAAAAEKLLHRVRRDAALAVGERRVEERQRVPEAPVGRPREEPEGIGLDRVGRHLLLLEDPPERLADLGARDRPEVEALAAREDRRGQPPRLRGGEDEDDVRRRLLQGLQERVERRLREHVDFVDDVDLAPPARRRVARVLAESRAPRRSRDSRRRRSRARRARGPPPPRGRARTGRRARRRRRAAPSQFRPIARRRAVVVLPTPRGPANRYAWAMRSCARALRSVRTTGAWPTTASKVSGRQRRART